MNGGAGSQALSGLQPLSAEIQGKIVGKNGKTDWSAI